jgi:hypothetical protein
MAVTEPIFTKLAFSRVFYTTDPISKLMKIRQTGYSLIPGHRQTNGRGIHIRLLFFIRKEGPINESGLADGLRPQLLLPATSTLIQPLKEREDTLAHTY